MELTHVQREFALEREELVTLRTLERRPAADRVVNELLVLRQAALRLEATRAHGARKSSTCIRSGHEVYHV